LPSDRPSDSFSLTGSFVRVVRGGRRPSLAFFRPEYFIDALGYRRIKEIRYLGWRIATRDERTVIRNYRPSIAVQVDKKRALANYGNISVNDRFSRPRPIRPGPKYSGPPKQPIQKAKFSVTYIDPKGVSRTRRLLYRFYDKKSLARFQKLEQSGKMPIPVSGDTVNYGLEPWAYRILRLKARRRGHGS
jgi:hypothetical protein